MSTDFDGLFWTGALTVVVIMLFGLTLLPALIEHRWPKDIQPLRVVREYDGNAANFAHGFASFVDSKFGTMLQSLAPDEAREERLPSGEDYLLLGKTALFVPNKVDSARATVRRLVVGAGAVALPEDILFAMEIYAAGDFSCGRLSACRAVLACGQATLGPGSAVLRWIHAQAALYADYDVQLFGRASSDLSIRLVQSVTFERLHAPKISFGAPDQDVPSRLLHPPVNAWEPEEYTKMGEGQWRVDGDADLPPASSCIVPLITLGALKVGDASWLQCAIKSNSAIFLGNNCRVDDAVIAVAGVDVGTGCHIKGPIISEMEVLLRRGCVVGSESAPATISAPRILIESGVTVYGTVWAREHGEVIRA